LVFAVESQVAPNNVDDGQLLAEALPKWNVDGAILTAKARAAWLSNDWEKLVKTRSLFPLAA
jgi:hypothetical protein